MKQVTAGLVFVIISSAVFAKTIKSIEQTYTIALKKCAESSYESTCNDVFEKLFSTRKYDQAYEVALAGCSVAIKSCESALTVVPFTKAKEPDALMKLLNKKCEANSSHCDYLVTIYKDKKQYKLALATAKKNFTRTGSLQYAILLQELKKDQKLIEKVSYQACTKNRKNCDTVLRYFSTPKNQEKIVARVQKECENQAAGGGGADYCSIVGTYYYKKGEIQKALKMWSHSCSYNELTCLLIIGSNKADRIIDIDSFNSFCKENQVTEATASQLRRKHCLIGVSEVPDEIKNHGKKLLESFVMQQR